MKMIYAYDTLKKEYRDKKIYVWDMNWDSVALFMMLAFRRIDVCGFVDAKEEYISEMYMNRPVVPLVQAAQEEGAVILIADAVPKSTVQTLPDDRAVYWKDACGIDELLREKKIIVYGTGIGADQLAEELKKENISIDLYCVTKREGEGQHAGKKVIEAAELGQYSDYAVLIGIRQPRFRWEILKSLRDFQGQVYLEMENKLGQPQVGVLDIYNIMLMQSVDLAIKRQRKIYLYGEKDLIAGLIEDALNIYGVHISGYVSGKADRQKNIQSIYDLAYDGVEDKLIIINEEFPENLLRAREDVELAGFSLEEENYTALQGYKFSKEQMLSKLPEYPDPLVGGSVFYKQGRPGWKVYGREEEGRVRIMVLGGSTSSEIYHPENWISKLYYKLSKNGIKATIYNGAHPGNDIVSEMLRFLRDAHILKPQIVISMSGVNNILYKQASNQFNEKRLIEWIRTLSPQDQYCSGVYDDEPLYSFWSRNVKLLNLICEFYGAKLFGFLQPINILMEHMSLREKSVFEGYLNFKTKGLKTNKINYKDFPAGGNRWLYRSYEGV